MSKASAPPGLSFRLEGSFFCELRSPDGIIAHHTVQLRIGRCGQTRLGRHEMEFPPTAGPDTIESTTTQVDLTYNDMCLEYPSIVVHKRSCGKSVRDGSRNSC
jgi:hypothetical protein